MGPNGRSASGRYGSSSARRSRNSPLHYSSSSLRSHSPQQQRERQGGSRSLKGHRHRSEAVRSVTKKPKGVHPRRHTGGHVHQLDGPLDNSNGNHLELRGSHSNEDNGDNYDDVAMEDDYLITEHYVQGDEPPRPSDGSVISNASTLSTRGTFLKNST